MAPNQEVLDYLKKWETDAATHIELTKSQQRLISNKLRFDLKSMIIGFCEICKIAFTRFPVTWYRTYFVKKQAITDKIQIQHMLNTVKQYEQYNP